MFQHNLLHKAPFTLGRKVSSPNVFDTILADSLIVHNTAYT